MAHKLLPEHQVLHLARMNASGYGTEAMCAASDLTPYIVKEIAAGRGLNDRQRLIFDKEHALGLQREHSAKIHHKQKMWEMSEGAYDVLKTILLPDQAQKHPDLSARTAWEVLKNAGIPVHTEKQITAGMTINTQINAFATEQGQLVMSKLSEALGEASQHMSPLPPINDGNKHTRVSEAEATAEQPKVRPITQQDEVLPPEPPEGSLSE